MPSPPQTLGGLLVSIMGPTAPPLRRLHAHMGPQGYQGAKEAIIIYRVGRFSEGPVEAAVAQYAGSAASAGLCPWRGARMLAHGVARGGPLEVCGVVDAAPQAGAMGQRSGANGVQPTLELLARPGASGHRP